MGLNGSAVDLAMALGRIEGEARAAHDRQTEILLSINARLIDLPERLAASSAASKASAAGTVPSPPSPWTLRRMLDAIKIAVPLAVVSLVVAGKLTWPEALPILRMALGL